MALFLSTVVNKVDRKGRVSVPAPFRAVVAGQSFQGIVAIPSFKAPALQCGGMDWMERLSAGVDGFDIFSEEHDALTAALFANAQPLAFDGEGRIVLPAPLMEHAHIADRACFAGRGPTFEIWQPEEFTRYQAEQTRLVSERGLTLRRPGDRGGER